jgi:pyrroline-5-carboxylate reductase
MTILGLINPGAMGASVGSAAASSGQAVIWASHGRSDASVQRANRAGLSDCGNLAALVSEAEVILSVCPPHEAENIARQVMDLGFNGRFASILPARHWKRSPYLLKSARHLPLKCPSRLIQKVLQHS